MDLVKQLEHKLVLSQERSDCNGFVDGQGEVFPLNYTFILEIFEGILLLIFCYWIFHFLHLQVAVLTNLLVSQNHVLCMGSVKTFYFVLSAFGTVY